MDTRMFRQGQTINNKYRVLGEVAIGETGAVYSAVELASGRRCTLKLLQQDAAEGIDALRQELDKARNLQHPNIAPITDIEETGEHQPFLVCEFVEGVRLDEMIRRQAPVPLTRACGIAKQIAQALEAAHHAGIVHGDLKPSKVILTPEGDAETIRVLGFGAFALKRNHFVNMARLALNTGGVWGAAEYVSPEQAVGTSIEALDGRSDVYSLGVILYQMLAGEVPFRGANTMEVLLAHVFSPPAPLDHPIGAEVPEALETLLMRMLAKGRHDRPASATALIDQLSAWEKHSVRAPALGEMIAGREPNAVAPAPLSTAGNGEDAVAAEPRPATPMYSPKAAGEEAATEPIGSGNRDATPPVFGSGTAGTTTAIFGGGSAAGTTFGSRKAGAQEDNTEAEDTTRVAPAPPWTTGGKDAAPRGVTFDGAEPDLDISRPEAAGEPRPDAGPQDSFVADLQPKPTAPALEPPQPEPAPLDVVLERQPRLKPVFPAEHAARHPEPFVSRAHLPQLGMAPKPAQSHRWAAVMIVILVLIGAGCGWLYLTGRTYWFRPDFVKGRLSSLVSSQGVQNPPAEQPQPGPQSAQATPPVTQSAPAATGPPASLPTSPPANTPATPQTMPAVSPNGRNAQATHGGNAGRPSAGKSAPPAGTPPAAAEGITPETSTSNTNIATSNQSVTSAPNAQRAQAAQSVPKPVTTNTVTIEEVIRRGDYYFNRGEYDSAISAYRSGLARDPANSRLIADIARAKKAKAAEAKYLGQ